MCNDLCVRGSDIGVYVDGDPVAYAHPGCPEHSDGLQCAHCEGWGNFAGRDNEESRLTCPMCDGTGSVAA